MSADPDEVVALSPPLARQRAFSFPRLGRTAFLVLFVAASALVSARYGIVKLTWSDLLQLWFPSFESTAATDKATVQILLFDIRIPRVLCALLIGAALSVSGAAYQGLFRNSLVSPDILGASSGAAFGAALGIIMSLGVFGVQTLAFATGMGAVLLTYTLSKASGPGHFTLKLVLTGMVVASLFMAGISVIKSLADPYSKLPLITFWLLGSLSAVTKGDLFILAPPVLVGSAALLALRWPLNAMALGEEEARAVGIPTGQVRAATLVFATLITSVSVAIAGVIGWIGLMAPHLVRFWIGPNHRDLLPCSALLGAGFLLWADNAARSVFTAELPLGAVTCAFGIPLFLFVLKRTQKAWSS